MTTMITGADGHVGKSLARWLINNTGENLLLLVRAKRADEQSRKVVALEELATSPRCSVVFSDLRDEKPFDAVCPTQLTKIIHCFCYFSKKLQNQKKVGKDLTSH